MRHAEICVKLLEMFQMLTHNMAFVLKEHYVDLGRNFRIRNQKSKTDSFILCINKLSLSSRLNKLILNDNTLSYCFTLFICGGPCHPSSFKQCSGDLGTASLLTYGKKKNTYVRFCIFTTLIW